MLSSAWHWRVHRLPSRKEGCILDLDSTRLLREDGQQEGVVDHRPKAAGNDVIDDANERSLQSVTQPDIYDVLVADGSKRRMICAYHCDLLSAKRQLNPSDVG